MNRPVTVNNRRVIAHLCDADLRRTNAGLRELARRTYVILEGQALVVEQPRRK